MGDDVEGKKNIEVDTVIHENEEKYSLRSQL